MGISISDNDLGVLVDQTKAVRDRTVTTVVSVIVTSSLELSPLVGLISTVSSSATNSLTGVVSSGFVVSTSTVHVVMYAAKRAGTMYKKRGSGI